VADPRPLPSLFRWEPGMRREGRPDIIVSVEVIDGDTVLWFERGTGGFDGEPAEGHRPDMGHGGTRGLVLDQVRAVLGDPYAYAMSDLGREPGEIEWFVWVPRPSKHRGRGPTEGDALLDALHRAAASGSLTTPR
jgi:hypothetical protein